MKGIKLLPAALCFCLFFSCSDIVDELASLHYDVVKLKECETELNATVKGLQEIVSSISIHYITEVTPILTDEGICIGYTLIYDDGREVVLFFGVDGANGHNGRSGVDGRDGSNGRDGWDGRDGRDGWDGRDGRDGKDGEDGEDGKDGKDGKDGQDGKDGEDGKDGQDGHSPVVGVAQDTDGKWFWTLDGEWMLDEKGNRIPVASDGVTPKMKIENGYWYYSYDNGRTWKELCEATANTPSIFSSIDYSSDYEYITITLSDGQVIRIPRNIELDVNFSEQSSYAINSSAPVNLEYSVFGGKGNCEVEAVTSSGLEASIDTLSGNSGTITVTASSDFREGKVLVFLHKHNKTFLKTYVFTLKYEGLSSYGTANCYVVNEAGEYSFYALVKGSSEEYLDGTPAKASVLWETFGTDEYPFIGSVIKSVSFADGYVSFATARPLKEGNAVIAVSNAEGNILWSWHIWITSYNPSKDYAIFESHPQTKVMMRNLGSLSPNTEVSKSIGLYYQWGRKDPFLGLSSRENQTQFAATSVIMPAPVTSGRETGRVSYAIAHPSTFICRTNNYEGWDPYYESVWGQEKTCYDPCPPGWQVPYYDGIWYEIDAYAENREGKFGKVLREPYSVPESWFPYSGNIYGGSGTWIDNILWSVDLWASCGSNWSESYSPEFNYFCQNGWRQNRSKSDACPVRCISQ